MCMSYSSPRLHVVRCTKRKEEKYFGKERSHADEFRCISDLCVSPANKMRDKKFRPLIEHRTSQVKQFMRWIRCIIRKCFILLVCREKEKKRGTLMHRCSGAHRYTVRLTRVSLSKERCRGHSDTSYAPATSSTWWSKWTDKKVSVSMKKNHFTASCAGPRNSVISPPVRKSQFNFALSLSWGKSWHFFLRW